ncbi:MAG: hypothetical protein ACYTFI_18570, partial [Planctomycetota bacterium]
DGDSPKSWASLKPSHHYSADAVIDLADWFGPDASEGSFCFVYRSTSRNGIMFGERGDPVSVGKMAWTGEIRSRFLHVQRKFDWVPTVLWCLSVGALLGLLELVRRSRTGKAPNPSVERPPSTS